MEIDIKNIGDKTSILFILVGPPASGKSTWGKNFAEKTGAAYVSTDSIRAEIGSGESDQSVSYAAFSIARQRVTNALSQRKNAIIDATNVNPKSRKDWINIGKSSNSYIVAIVFEVSKEELYKRDLKRDRHVGKEIIDRFVDKYSRPDTTEVDKVIIK